MAFIITVQNTDTGATAEVTVGAIEDLTGDHITGIHLSASGRGVSSQDLLMLEYLGLRLPGRDVPPAGSVPALPSDGGGLVDPLGELIPQQPTRPKSWPGKRAGRPAPVDGGAAAPAKKAAAKKAAGAVVKAVATPVKPVKPPAKAAAKKAAAKKAAQSAAGHRGVAARAAKSATGGGRAYRTAPPVEELQAAMAKHGGPGAVAEAMGVPRHTIAGWLRRYRDLGHEFPTSGNETLPVETDGGK